MFGLLLLRLKPLALMKSADRLPDHVNALETVCPLGFTGGCTVQEARVFSRLIETLRIPTPRGFRFQLRAGIRGRNGCARRCPWIHVSG